MLGWLFRKHININLNLVIDKPININLDNSNISDSHGKSVIIENDSQQRSISNNHDSEFKPDLTNIDLPEVDFGNEE